MIETQYRSAVLTTLTTCRLLRSSDRDVSHCGWVFFFIHRTLKKNQCCLIKLIATFTVTANCFRPFMYTLLQTVYQFITLKAGQAFAEVSSHCKSLAVFKMLRQMTSALSITPVSLSLSLLHRTLLQYLKALKLPKLNRTFQGSSLF